MPIDRNRGSGRVPGSPWNLSIRPTRSPAPPPIDLQLLHFPPPFLFTVLSTVPSPTHLLFRFFTEFQVLFSSLSTNIPSTSSPFLLFHFFLFPSSFSFTFQFLCFHPLRIDLPISFRTSSKDFFSLLTDTPQIFLPVGSQKIAEILRSPLSVLIRAFVPATLRERTQHFSIKYQGSADETSDCADGRCHPCSRTFFGLMITEGLLDHTREPLLFFLPYFIDDFLIFA